MSKEFFETMEKIEKITKDIKFLENSHPEISNHFMQPAIEALEVVSRLESDLKSDLRKIHSKPVKKKKAKNGIKSKL